MKSLFERLRTRRLASTFVLLGTLSIAIVAGSFAAHGVRDRAAAGTSAIQTCTAPMLRTKGERADSIRLVETASAPGSFR